MNIENKSSKEIQQLIFEELKAGSNAEKLKNELKQKGIITEGYYFITEEERNKIIEEPKTAAGTISTKQVIFLVISLILLVFRIARCSNKM